MDSNNTQQHKMMLGYKPGHRTVGVYDAFSRELLGKVDVYEIAERFPVVADRLIRRGWAHVWQGTNLETVVSLNLGVGRFGIDAVQ